MARGAGMTGRPGRSHHGGTYARRARVVRQVAYANKHTLCWRCHRTLAEVMAANPGKRITWQAGHVVDGQVEGELRAECSHCNASFGAKLGNSLRAPRTQQWF